MKKRIITAVVLTGLIFTAFPATAQQSSIKDFDAAQMILGQDDKFIQFGAGVIVPLFSHFYNTKEVVNLNPVGEPVYDGGVGGAGALAFDYFLLKGLSVGAELGGSFLLDNGNQQYMVYANAVVGYTFRIWPFDIPLKFGTGVLVNSYSDEIFVGAVFKPSAGFYWNITDEWSFGGDLHYWIVPEIYTDNVGYPYDSSNFTHFMGFTLSGRYRF